MSEPKDPSSADEDFRTGRPDTPLEHVADAVFNTVVPGFDKKFQQILNDADAEAAADKTMLETEQRLMDERPSATGAGVDISVLQAADPTFDGQLFLSVARESVERIREARNMDNPHFADAQLSPQLMTELKTVIAGDVAAHRHHLLIGLEIKSAVISAAAVTDSKLNIIVRFHFEAEELDRDHNAAVIAGDETEREWDEDWTFWRDPAVDPSAVDNERTFAPLDHGGWLFAHKGWVVTAIQRIGAPDPLDPTNL